MFGSNVLEVAIGIVFIYLLLSLICSAVNELIASTLNQRGKNLFDGIKNILNDPKFTGLAQQLYTHGLIQGISKDASNPNKPNRLPSYISPDNFSLALLDILSSKGAGERGEDLVEQRKSELEKAKIKLDSNPADPNLVQNYDYAKNLLEQAEEIKKNASILKEAHNEAESAAMKVVSIKNLAGIQNASAKLEKALSIGRAIAEKFPDQLENIQKGVESLPDGHTKESILVLLTKTRREISAKVTGIEDHVEAFQKNLETWFNNSMDRVNGWYKRWTQKIVMAIAILMITILNADTIMLVKKFSNDSVLRAAIVTAAEREVQSAVLDSTGNSEARGRFINESQKLGIPLGWFSVEKQGMAEGQIPDTFGGWLLKLLGLVITTVAVSLGAPFWFDVLKKIVNVRGAGIPPGSTKKT